jgi:hypothetical protein
LRLDGCHRCGGLLEHRHGRANRAQYLLAFQGEIGDRGLDQATVLQFKENESALQFPYVGLDFPIPGIGVLAKLDTIEFRDLLLGLLDGLGHEFHDDRWACPCKIPQPIIKGNPDIICENRRMYMPFLKSQVLFSHKIQ